MKKFTFLFSAILLTAALNAQTWKKEQLMPTAELAQVLTTTVTPKPLVFNVGPMDNIKSAKFIGRGTSVTAVEKLKGELNWENKNRTIVVYCGCCSLSSCPNIRPIYDALLAQGFKNAKVLEIPEGIKPDWVAKGYPMEEESK